MKKILLLILFSYNLFAQSSNVGSLTTSQMTAMAMVTPSPIPVGYLAYSMDGTKGYYRWTGIEWVKITDNPELLAVMGAIPTNTNQLANGAGYITSVPAQSYSSLTGKPTTLSGYGIIDAYPLVGNPTGFITSIPAQSYASLTGKPTTLAGYGIVDGFTTANARSAISLTTIGSGSPTYTSGTGVINIPNNSNVQPQFYNSSGLIAQQIKVWNGIVTPSTGNGQTVDISSAGFSTILNVQAQVESNTASATSVPLVSIKSYTTTSVVTNIIVSNNSTIGSLLSPIVGLLFATNLTGYKLHVQVTGY